MFFISIFQEIGYLEKIFRCVFRAFIFACLKRKLSSYDHSLSHTLLQNEECFFVFITYSIINFGYQEFNYIIIVRI